MRLLAFCPSCHFFFPSRSILAAPGVTVTVGTVIEPCPRCGAIAGPIEGTYTFAKEAVNVAAGLSKKPQLLIDARDLAQRAAQQAISKDDAVTAAFNIAPEFGRLIEKAYGLVKNPWAVLGLLIGIGGLFQAHYANEANDEAMRLLLEAQREQVRSQEQIKELLRRFVEKEEGDRSRAEEEVSGPPARPEPQNDSGNSETNTENRTNRHQRRRADALKRKRKR